MSSSTSVSKFLRRAGALTGFLALLFVFDRAGYYLFRQMESLFYQDKVFQQQFQDYVHGKKFSTLILGTSRTFEAIHPHYFTKILKEKAYKEAQFGKNPKYNYYFYQFYKRHAGVPRVIIYGVDYFIFNSRSRKRWLGRLGHLHEPFQPFSAFSLLWTHRDDTEDFIDAVIERLDNALARKGDQEVKDLLSLQAYQGTPHVPGSVLTARPRRFRRQAYRPYPGREGSYLRRLLEEAEADGATTILLLIPDYIGTFHTNFAHRRQIRDLLRLKHGLPHVHIVNFNDPQRFPLQRADFFINGGWGRTNSHMSRSGSALLNRRLLRMLRNLYKTGSAVNRRPGVKKGER